MEEKTFFYTMFVLFLFYNLNKLDIFNHILQLFNNISFDDVDFTEPEPESVKPTFTEQKYEDKFLIDIRKMEKEYIFDDTESQLLEEKVDDFFKTSLRSLNNKREEIKDKLYEIALNLEKIQEDSDDYDSNSKNSEHNNSEDSNSQHNNSEDNNSEDNNSEDSYEIFEKELALITKEERQIEKEQQESDLLFSKDKLSNELKEIDEFLENQNGKEKLLQEAKENARNFIINKRLEKIENCYTIETTPQGNVLMCYDSKRNSFKYFSDSTIPYRYLEVVARKYVKQFQCRQLFVDMEEELKLAEEQNEKEEKEEKEAKETNEAKDSKEEKKSVFAKFKSYNKDVGRVSKNIPPKNSIPITKEQENKKILLKERANRYTYEGKFANFSFLKKVDRKLVNKKYGLSFSDFKKLQNK